jgi:hypothetical protein
MSCFRKPNGVYHLCIGLSLLIPGTGAVLALGPSQAELDQSEAATENWLMTNKSYDGHRYVALDQINTKNVGDLRETCALDSHVAAPAQSAPVLYERRIFLSRVPRSRADQIRDPLAGEPHPAREDRPSSDVSCWTTAERGAAFLCKFHLSGGKLDKAAPGRRQG